MRDSQKALDCVSIEVSTDKIMARSYLLGAALVLILGVTLAAVLPVPTTIESSWSEMTTAKPVSSIYWSCDFEQPTSNDTILGCGIQQSVKKPWRRWRGETHSVDTGPDMANTGDYYIYTEASASLAVHWISASIVLPDIGLTGKVCLKFAYSMFGYHIESLWVKVIGEVRSEVIWMEEGDQGKGWRTSGTELHLSEGDHISFTAVRDPYGYAADIALDSLVITTGDC